MFAEEMARVFGVPFELIPFKVKPVSPQPPRPDPNHMVSGYHQSGQFEVYIDCGV